MLLLRLVLAFSLFFHAHSEVLRVHHRLYHPSVTPLPYSLRTTIDTSDFSLSAHSADHLQPFAVQPPDDALYQLALEREGDTDWVVSSVKACHFQSATAESIILHLSSGQEVYNLNYFVFPVPHDGSCPEPVAEARTFLTPSNSTIHLRYAKLPPLPELRLPPPLTPEGRAVTPEPEQTFFQKYWMYIVGVLLVMILAPAPAEEGTGPSQSGPVKK